MQACRLSESSTSLHKIKIDANTEIPPKKYLEVDSVDVNPSGVLYDRNWIKPCKKPHIYSSLNMSAQGDIKIAKRDVDTQASSDKCITEDDYYQKDGDIYRIKVSIDTLDRQPTFEQYPNVAEKIGLIGRVITSFIVERNGSVTNVKIISSKFAKVGRWGGVNTDFEPLDDQIGEHALQNENIRVVKMMPRWNPGKLNGSTIRVKYALPITFIMQ